MPEAVAQDISGLSDGDDQERFEDLSYMRREPRAIIDAD
jgi:hypothetical protein